MRTPPLASQLHLSLAGDPLPALVRTGPADTPVRRRAELLHALGGPAAVIAAGAGKTSDCSDDWSGSFDMHLGIYTSD